MTATPIMAVPSTPAIASIASTMAAAIVVVPVATVTTIPTAPAITVPPPTLMSPVIASWRRLVITRCRLINPRLVVIPRCWLVVACRRCVIPARGRVVTAIRVVRPATGVIRRGGRVHLGTVVTASSIGIGHARTERQSHYSYQKNSTEHFLKEHGGLLDRE